MQNILNKTRAIQDYKINLVKNSIGTNREVNVPLAFGVYIFVNSNGTIREVKLELYFGVYIFVASSWFR